MRTNNKIIRIIETGFPIITFISQNGERRVIDIKKCFKQIGIEKGDFGYEVIEKEEVFKTVTLIDNALAWKKVFKKTSLPSGRVIETFFHLDPLMTIKQSGLLPSRHLNYLAKKLKQVRLKENLTQKDLADRIGTDKHYISKVENSKTDLEIKTLEKILEVGLDKEFCFFIYDKKDNITSITNEFLNPKFVEWVNTKKNDLTIIEGIGPKISKLFISENILSPKHLSTIHFYNILKILKKHKEPLALYPNIDSWRIQAKCIEMSDWASLIFLQREVGKSHSKIEDLARKELKEEIFVL